MTSLFQFLRADHCSHWLGSLCRRSWAPEGAASTQRSSGLLLCLSPGSCNLAKAPLLFRLSVLESHTFPPLHPRDTARVSYLDHGSGPDLYAPQCLGHLPGDQGPYSLSGVAESRSPERWGHCLQARTAGRAPQGHRRAWCPGDAHGPGAVRLQPAAGSLWAYLSSTTL